MFLSQDELKVRKMVAVAGRALKPSAIRAVLASGLLHGLLAGKRTARALIGPLPDG